MSKLEFYGKVDDDGVLTLRNRKQLKEDLKELKGKNVTVTIEKTKKNRSAEQNRWYWACIALLSDHTGYDKNKMHEIVKYKFLKGELVDIKTGEVYEYLKSSADLTTTEFSVFMEQLIQWSAESLQVVLPLPGEQLEVFA